MKQARNKSASPFRQTWKHSLLHYHEHSISDSTYCIMAHYNFTTWSKFIAYSRQAADVPRLGSCQSNVVPAPSGRDSANCCREGFMAARRSLRRYTILCRRLIEAKDQRLDTHKSAGQSSLMDFFHHSNRPVLSLNTFTKFLSTTFILYLTFHLCDQASPSHI